MVLIVIVLTLIALKTTKPLPEVDVFKLCDAVIQSGREYSAKFKCPCPLMYAYHGTEYIGKINKFTKKRQLILRL